VPVVEAAVSPGGTALSHRGWPALAWWAGAALGWTVGWGALLGHRRAWVLLLASAVTAPVLLLGCWLALVLTWPPVTAPAGAGDGGTAAAAGLVVLTLPALLAIALPLGIGAGTGWCVRLGARWRPRGGPAGQAAPKS
jgi:hypothetical protein